MTTKIEIERFSLISEKTFADVLTATEAGIAHPNMSELFPSIRRTQTASEMEKLIHKAAGPAGLMLFAKFDHGEVIFKDVNGARRGAVRLLIGNPLIMASMARHVPDAGSYAPVTVLIDERSDGVHLSYDKMESFLAPYGNPEALEIAIDLDKKVQQLLEHATS